MFGCSGDKIKWGRYITLNYLKFIRSHNGEHEIDQDPDLGSGFLLVQSVEQVHL